MASYIILILKILFYPYLFLLIHRYVTETAFAVDTTDPAMAEFASILERFKAPDPEDEEKEKEKENENEDGNAAAVVRCAPLLLLLPLSSALSRGLYHLSRSLIGPAAPAAFAQ